MIFLCLVYFRYIAVCFPFFRLRHNIKARSYIIPILLFAPLYNVPRFFEFDTVNNVSLACLDNRSNFANVTSIPATEPKKMYALNNNNNNTIGSPTFSSPTTQWPQEGSYNGGLTKNSYLITSTKANKSSSIPSNQIISWKDSKASLSSASNLLTTENQAIGTENSNTTESNGVSWLSMFTSFELCSIKYTWMLSFQHVKV